jgi:hypothetical protein
MRLPTPAEINIPGGIAFPDIFFTAGINGCSVFVRGPLNAPTVYHAGIDGPLPGGDAVAHWRNLFRAVAGNPAVFGEVNKLHYANAKRRDYNPDMAGPDADQVVGTADSQTYRQFLKGLHGDALGIEQVVPWGAVFGIRTGGNWTFYLQENVQIFAHGFTQQPRFRLLGSMGPMQTVAQGTKNRSRPIVVRQVFPVPLHGETIRPIGFV